MCGMADNLLSGKRATMGENSPQTYFHTELRPVEH